MTVRYLQIEANASLPQLSGLPPFKAIVLCDMAVTPDWQWNVSNHLIHSGCLFMLAWGIACSSWDDSFDWANIFQFELKGIPEDKSVMTTWHEDETIEEVFHFCKFHARHPIVAIEDVLIFHISSQNASGELLELYRKLSF